MASCAARGSQGHFLSSILRALFYAKIITIQIIDHQDIMPKNLLNSAVFISISEIRNPPPEIV